MVKKLSAFFMVFVILVAGCFVEARAAAVQINEVSVTEVSSSGYRVTVYFTASSGVSKVLMPTWTASGGQDDLVWHQAEVGANSASFYIPAGQHGGQSGNYITHIYVYDRSGQFALRGVETVLPAAAASAAPTISSAFASEVTASGYRVTVQFSAPAGVSKVLMPTWTEANGQDDLVWHQASVSGNTAEFYVPAAGHKGENGKYITHVYVYDSQNRYALIGVETTVPAASSGGGSSSGGQTLAIGEVSVTEVTSAGYRVTAKITAPAGVSKVEMPTWTEANGQDDLVWHQAAVNGDTAAFYVPVSSHKGESGKYITHIYLYDKTGNKVLKGTEITVPAPSSGGGSSSGGQTLSIGEVSVTEVTSAGYRVTAKITAPAGVSKVEMPTWTEANGQDDLVWHQAAVSGDTATFYVQASSHKGESGKYITHIYLYDKAGNKALKGTEAVLPPSSSGGSGGSSGGSGSGTGVLSIGIPFVTELSTGGFRLTAQFNAPAGYSRIAAAVWTSSGGQDDLVWHDMTVSGNMATVYVPVSAHNNEHGPYVVNAYVFESDSKYCIQGLTVPVP